MKQKRGYIHLYTGNGKGKTTAAMGLALRAAGAGMKVFIVQFLKGQASAERKAFERLSDLVTIMHFGTGQLIKDKPTDRDMALAAEGLIEARRALISEEYDVVILDEIAVAVHFGLIPLEDVLSLIKEKPSFVELVLTGRYADPALIEAASLVTEMKDIKHYYDQGVAARKGIES
ncbi:MAG TPA: cob(I)yrinic acid a,c-diamide adenosyltransferase [Thermodesulfobacteriota bacterium]|nr:cob(I)yrinic acid a,c-diamide adenosyltransferase [Deltaproteobacteria bacterium]HNR12807.1 cob(I)yrinic acid a,c-diamide adenosyltransferase [Thermodesulfobacteriota bacterium]HNU71101.1 cob(I)yrinic acid a,c-diamide adenosyltransferase [Thermodesulfobacteriota bacterium]HOC38042.1 cob(I)yrinic acid a,c-diamide adenosyltransferase [Thermodesulfobacteriota bacterium]HQO77974.1 cob(I)yrinic acid a,c-diamide adenosyltransferase [Thermodesulfobacteriota bacterium]